MDNPSTYENFDLKPPRRGLGPVTIGISLTLVTLLLGGGYLAWTKDRQAKDEIQNLNRQVQGLTQLLQEKEDDMQSLLAGHRNEIERLNGDWETRLAKLEEEQDSRLQQSYQTIAKIVNDSGTTMQYMKDLETKMKSGAELHQQEIDELKAVAGGLAYLHSQYEKPLYEFKELDTYLARQMQVQAEKPEDRVKLFKQLFSKKYREENDADWEAYYRDRGRISAVSAARGKVSEAYARAQSQMGAIKLDSAQWLAGLDEIVKSKEGNTELMESFFEVSAEILKVHQGVMDVKVEAPPATGETVSP